MAPSINITEYLKNLGNNTSRIEQKLPLLWHWRSHIHDSETTEGGIYPSVVPDQLKYWDHLPVLPIIATLILTLTVFLLLIFQRNPSLVAGIVAAGLGAIAIYLFLSNMHEHKLRFE